MDLKDLLNDRKWNQGDLEACTVVVRHRGAPGDQREVDGTNIDTVHPNGMQLNSGTARWTTDADCRAVRVNKTTFLPWHRVIEIRDPQGESLWTRSS